MNTSSGTLRRLERLLVMVPWLLENPGVDLDEVGERFGADPAELLGDLDLLGYCGLPGYGGGDLIEVSLVGGSVHVRMADYFRRPLRLSLREAVTLLLAARAVANLEGLSESAPLERAAVALERLLGADGQAGTAAPAAFALDLAAPGEEHMPALRDAVASRRLVHLTYRSPARAETTERDVEPWRLTLAGGAWYLQGHCRVAGGPRDFRLERIRDLAVMDERTGAPPADVLPPVYRPEDDDLRVVLDLDPPAWWLSGWAVVEEVRERKGLRRVTLRTASVEWAARLALRLAPHVRVVEPAEVRARVVELASQTLAGYEDWARY